VSEHKVHVGGLMRCCIDTLNQASDLDQFKTIVCKYCGAPMTRDAKDVWRWDPEKPIEKAR
jgi:hypothetical protein